MTAPESMGKGEGVLPPEDGRKTTGVMAAEKAAKHTPRLIVKPARASVPCDGCRACCVNDAIILHPKHGDDVTAYDAEPITHPLTGKPAMMLKHKPNGECVYLGPTGCTIHAWAPAICREYDCRKQFASMSRQERRLLIKLGLMDKEKFEAGRKRLHTLSPPSKAQE